MRNPTPDLIRVFDCDPDLLAGVAEPAAMHLRTRMAARLVRVERGPWRPTIADDERNGHLGLLIIDGLLVRTLHFAGRESSEVVGPGDLIRPWDAGDAGGSIACESEWRVLKPTLLACLDGPFAARVANCPTIMAALLERSARRSRGLVQQATIAHIRRADRRLLLLLWHLADRWGRVTPQGVVVPVPLTHQLLAQLTCLRRPTVSAALGELVEAGEIASLRGSGGWLLLGGPPEAFGEDGRGLRRPRPAAAPIAVLAGARGVERPRVAA